MSTFVKTFIVCLVVCLSIFVYKFLMSESYSPDLSISDDNPVFSTGSKYDDVRPDEQADTLPVEDNLKKDEVPVVKNKYEYTCYFYSGAGKLISTKREFSKPQSLENNIKMLLKGPTIQESRQGIYSEIPKNVDLLSVSEKSDKVIVNLTSAFGQGGGSQSVENRVKQLSMTVKNFAKNKKVYLYIDNQEVEYLGGEGVYIKQPLD